MPYLLLAFTLLIITIFGCASISNSYASAKQAEAVIEASRTAQLALGSQSVISILLALVVVILIFVVLALLYKLLKKQPTILQQSFIPTDHFLQDGLPALDSTSTKCQFSVTHNETENEFPMLPPGWGW